MCLCEGCGVGVRGDVHVCMLASVCVCFPTKLESISMADVAILL